MCVLLATVCIFIGSPLSLLVFDVFVWFFYGACMQPQELEHNVYRYHTFACFVCTCGRVGERRKSRNEADGKDGEEEREDEEEAEQEG